MRGNRWHWIGGLVFLIGSLLALATGPIAAAPTLGAGVVQATPPPMRPVALGNTCLSSKQSGWHSWPISYQPKAVFALRLEGNTLWAGTALGIRKVNPANGAYSTALLQEPTHGFLPVGEGRLWTHTDFGPAFFAGTGWRHVPSTQSAGYAYVSAMGRETGGRLWFSFTAGRSSFWYYTDNPIPPAEGPMELQSGSPPTWDFYDCNVWQAVSSGVAHHGSVEECRLVQSARAGIEQFLGSSPYLMDAGTNGVWWGLGDRFGRWANGKIREWKVSTGLIHSLEAAPDGGVWVGTEKGLGYFNPRTGRLRWVDIGLGKCTVPGEVLDVAVDNAGRVWVSTYGGLFRLISRGSQWQRYNGFGTVNTTAVLALAVTPDGTLWASRGGALWRVGTSRARAIPAPNLGCEANIQTLVADRQGRLWGLVPGCGVLEYQPAGGQWTLHTPPAALDLQALAIAPDGTLYTAGGNTLSVYRGQTWETAATLPWFAGYQTPLAADSNGGVWIKQLDASTVWYYRDGQLNSYLGGVEESGGGGLAVDGAGQLWIGARTGVKRYDGQSWTTFPAATVPERWPTKLVRTQDNRIWVVRGGELLSFNPAAP